jgi:DNA mismatch repair protein MutL
VPSPGFFSSLTYLGQLELTYLVCEAPCELVLIDQHAAHERVAYEALLAGHQSRTIQRQALLFPHTVDLDRHLAAAALESQDLLRDVGFELEPFGDTTGGASAFALKAVPAGIRSAEDPTGILRRMLSELSEHGGSRAIEQRIEAALATVACHSVVRAGDRLTPAEVIALLRSLDQIEFRAHCPHGRPVLLRLGTDELARRFGRL